MEHRYSLVCNYLSKMSIFNNQRAQTQPSNSTMNKQLVIGGARSGKSRFAERVAMDLYRQTKVEFEDDAKLFYLATATAGDKEMLERIEQHQQQRDNAWELIEEPIKLAKLIKRFEENSTVLIDCLTLWLSNCLHTDCWQSERSALLSSLSVTKANIILVSNEVGSGIVPMGKLSRRFVDEGGWLHQQLAAQCESVTLVVAGLPLVLKE